MFYFAPDLHLGGSLREGHSILSKDWTIALDSAVNVICADAERLPKDEPRVFILPGDIFDTAKVDGTSIHCLKEALHKLRVNDISTWATMGNHDLQRQGGTPLAEAIGCHSLTPTPQLLCGKLVAGIDYCPREQLLPKLAELATKGPVDLLVLHCAMQEFLGFAGAYDLSGEEIPDNVKNVLVGDVHVADLAEKAGGWLLSPGVLHAKDVGQDKPKGIWKWNGSDAPEWLRIWSRAIKHVEADASTIDAVIDSLPKLGPKTSDSPVLDAKVTNDCVAQLRRAAMPGGPLEGYIILERRKTAEAEDENVRPERLDTDNRPTLLSALPFAVDRTTQPQLFDFLVRLLTEPNAKAVLDEEVQKLLCVSPTAATAS